MEVGGAHVVVARRGRPRRSWVVGRYVTPWVLDIYIWGEGKIGGGGFFGMFHNPTDRIGWVMFAL